MNWDLLTSVMTPAAFMLAAVLGIGRFIWGKFVKRLDQGYADSLTRDTAMLTQIKSAEISASAEREERRRERVEDQKRISTLELQVAEHKGGQQVLIALYSGSNRPFVDGKEEQVRV